MVQALAEATGLDGPTIAQRLMGYTQAGKSVARAGFRARSSRRATPPPRPTTGGPIRSSSPINSMRRWRNWPGKLGPTEGWIAEWKFDGIRAQLLTRGPKWTLWSRGEELISDAFPEFAEIAAALPDGVAVDGEIVVARGDGDIEGIAPFADLQQRLNRKTLTEKHKADLPVVLVAYDLLQEGGVDISALPQIERRARLDEPRSRGGRGAAAAEPARRGGGLAGAVRPAGGGPRASAPRG